MASSGRNTTARLLGFNQQVLDQALAVVGAHLEQGSPPYVGAVGSHLRHVIEHYEALVRGLQAGRVDYDSRLRDRQLEACPITAHDRLRGLRQQLGQWTPGVLDQPVRVLGLGGMAGDFSFDVPSSVGRELAFVASHAVHHFALLVPHLQRHAVPVPAHFGVAPATVAHALATHRAALQPDLREISCLTPTASA